MNRIVIIGNGFDLAHDLPTKYEDFINYLKDEFARSIKQHFLRYERVFVNNSKYFELTLKETDIDLSSHISCYNIDILRDSPDKWEEVMNTIEVIHNHKSHRYRFHGDLRYKNPLVRLAVEATGDSTWGGIENDYRIVLSKIITSSTDDREKLQEIISLNNSLKDLIDDLAIYLKSLKKAEFISKLMSAIYTRPLETWNTTTKVDNQSALVKSPIIDKILFLNFNYTATIEQYQIDIMNNAFSKSYINCNRWINNNTETYVNFIHGDLRSLNVNPMIFGYGDEQDKHHSTLEEMHNEFLKHIKTILYTQTAKYREMIDFADAGKFDIIIYGHSCSNTDRTLLNTLFEHDNCVSIQPYLYDRNDTSIYNNIYRCFKDKKLMRSRVVDKTNTIQS